MVRPSAPLTAEQLATLDTEVARLVRVIKVVGAGRNRRAAALCPAAWAEPVVIRAIERRRTMGEAETRRVVGERAAY